MRQDWELYTTECVGTRGLLVLGQVLVSVDSTDVYFSSALGALPFFLPLLLKIITIKSDDLCNIC